MSTRTAPRTRAAALATGAAMLGSLLAVAPTSPAFAQDAGDGAGTITTPNGVCAAAGDAGYADVPDGAYYADAADCLASLDVAGTALVGGYPDGTFRPRRSITRADAAQFVVRLVGYVAGQDVTDTAATTTFEDLEGVGPRQSAAIASLVDLGVVSGYSATRFGPGNVLSRGEAATLLVRADEAARSLRPDDVLPLVGELRPAPRDRFSDDDGSVHEPAISSLFAAGVIEGVDSSFVEPAAPLVRADLAALEGRYLQFVTDSSNPRSRGALVEPEDLPEQGTQVTPWRVFSTRDDLVDTEYFLDPCNPTDYPTDAQRDGGFNRLLFVTDSETGDTIRPMLEQATWTYDSASVAADALTGIADVVQACPIADNDGTTIRYRQVGAANDQRVVVSVDQAGDRFYVVAVRSRSTVSLGMYRNRGAAPYDAEAGRIADAMLAEVREADPAA